MIPMNPVIELIKSHRSIRKFKSDPVAQEIVEELIRAGQCAATSSFIQACTVIQVSDIECREKLCEAAAGQPYVKDSPVFLVFCADMQRHQLACDMHGSEMLSGFIVLPCSSGLGHEGTGLGSTRFQGCCSLSG